MRSRYKQFIPWESGRLCRMMCTVETLGNISGPIMASIWIIDNAKEHIQIYIYHKNISYRSSN